MMQAYKFNNGRAFTAHEASPVGTHAARVLRCASRPRQRKPEQAPPRSIMEFLPSSSDLTTPKATLVQTSLFVVVLTAIGLRFWLRRTYLPLNQPPLRTEEFAMTSKDFGDQDETRRDVSRAYVGGGIHLQLPPDADGDSFTVKLTPPPGSGSGVDKEAVKANLEAFIAELRAQLPEHQIADASVARILPSTHRTANASSPPPCHRRHVRPRSRPLSVLLASSFSLARRCSRAVRSAHRQPGHQRSRCGRQAAYAQGEPLHPARSRWR